MTITEATNVTLVRHGSTIETPKDLETPDLANEISTLLVRRRSQIESPNRNDFVDPYEEKYGGRFGSPVSKSGLKKSISRSSSIKTSSSLDGMNEDFSNALQKRLSYVESLTGDEVFNDPLDEKVNPKHLVGRPLPKNKISPPTQIISGERQSLIQLDQLETLSKSRSSASTQTISVEAQSLYQLDQLEIFGDTKQAQKSGHVNEDLVLAQENRVTNIPSTEKVEIVNQQILAKHPSASNEVPKIASQHVLSIRKSMSNELADMVMERVLSKSLSMLTESEKASKEQILNQRAPVPSKPNKPENDLKAQKVHSHGVNSPLKRSFSATEGVDDCDFELVMIRRKMLVNRNSNKYSTGETVGKITNLPKIQVEVPSNANKSSNEEPSEIVKINKKVEDPTPSPVNNAVEGESKEPSEIVKIDKKVENPTDNPVNDSDEVESKTATNLGKEVLHAVKPSFLGAKDGPGEELGLILARRRSIVDNNEITEASQMI